MPRLANRSAAASPRPEMVGAVNDFRRFFQLDARGVAIVTVGGADGPSGLTVTSFCSLSAKPPLLLVCLTNGSRTLRQILAEGAFAFHFLRSDQGHLCEIFARQEENKGSLFADVNFTLLDGVPVLSKTLAWTVCQLQHSLRAGDHTIVMGQMIRMQCQPGVPLVWHASRQCEVAAVNEPLYM